MVFIMLTGGMLRKLDAISGTIDGTFPEGFRIWHDVGMATHHNVWLACVVITSQDIALLQDATISTDHCLMTCLRRIGGTTNKLSPVKASLFPSISSHRQQPNSVWPGINPLNGVIFPLNGLAISKSFVNQHAIKPVTVGRNQSGVIISPRVLASVHDPIQCPRFGTVTFFQCRA